jgi:hypothetical protein
MHDVFSGVAEIEQVFLSNDGDSGLGALIVVDQKDYTALRRIFELETDIIKALPDTKITFDVVIRDGRSLGDVVSPRGRLLYQR